MCNVFCWLVFVEIVWKRVKARRVMSQWVPSNRHHMFKTCAAFLFACLLVCLFYLCLLIMIIWSGRKTRRKGILFSFVLWSKLTNNSEWDSSVRNRVNRQEKSRVQRTTGLCPVRDSLRLFWGDAPFRCWRSIDGSVINILRSEMAFSRDKNRARQVLNCTGQQKRSVWCESRWRRQFLSFPWCMSSSGLSSFVICRATHTHV